MIVRKIEVCPKCGKWDPWRRYSSRVVNGERRNYVKCVNCGAKEVIICRSDASEASGKPAETRKLPDSGNNPPPPP